MTKRFGDIIALDRINLSINDGEYVCVLGPTGAGKTTLLRIIAGLLDLDDGEIHIEGKVVNTLHPEERNAVYMFQQFALFPHMNVWQNISFGPIVKDYNEDTVEKMTTEILEMVRLTERGDAFPNELSGGMQQRVALARGIASGARILLLDEPLGALDARLRIDLRSQLRKLAKDQGLTVIHVTHDQEEALMIADRVVILRAGRIVQIGSPYEIYTKPQSIFVANFVGGANFIEGNVVRIDDTGSLIELLGGLQIHISDISKTVGDKIVIALRFKDITIGLDEVSGSNNFTGTIQSAVFLGDSMEYQIRLENGLMVSAKILLSDAFQAYTPGDKITVSVLPEKCYVFAYPKIGLLKEIEAI